MMQCNSKFVSKIFYPENVCFHHGAEKPSSSTESAEKPKALQESFNGKESGIPIDTKADAAKDELNKWEKMVQEKYGGQFYTMSDAGVEGSDSEMHISSPDFSDPKFKGKEPRVIVWFHQNGGQDYSNKQAKKVYEQVKKMRENGDPVVLVMPQDRKKKGTKNWSDFTNDKAFKALIGQAEKVTGQQLAKNISFASSSGGYKGIGNVLRSLREAGDPRAKELYQGIKQIGLCDSLYGEEDELAHWAVSDPQKRLYSYNGTEEVRKHNKILEKKIQGLLTKMDRTMGDNIQILSEDMHKAGHDVDKRMLAKYLEAPPNSQDYGLNFPPRAPDAMTGKQFNEALKGCKTLEQRQNLIISQAAKGAFSSNFMKPKVYKTTIGGKQVEVPLYGMVRFGTPGNETIVSMDGQTSQAVADMLQGHLPTAHFYKHLYKDPRIKKAPFWYGQKLEGLVSSRNGSPMPYHTTLNGKTVPSGAAMRSAEYSAAHSDMYIRWCEQNGIKPDEFTLGHRKTVFMPHGANSKKIKFGGGLHAIPVLEDGRIVNWKVQPDQFVQGVGDLAHTPSYYDYAQGGDIMGDPIIDGKRVSFRDILSKPEYEDIRIALFSKKALGPEARYNMPSWMRSKVDDHLRKYPPGTNRPYIASSSIGTPSDQPIAANETVPTAGGGVPVDTTPSYSGAGGEYSGGGGGRSYGGGGYSPETTPASYSPPVENVKEQIEVQPTGKVFVLGDSLSDGFIRGMKGLDVTHTHPAGKDKSMGQTAREMVTTLKQKILTQKNLAGSTLVVVGGSNDIFSPNSLDRIKKDLQEIYTLAKAKGMNVVGATLPPLAHSSYSKRWAIKTNTPYEQYNKELVDRWQNLNNWIMGKEGAKDSSGIATGPDKVMQFHKKFEDPTTPGKLRPDLYGKQGDGVHLANYGEMSQFLRSGIDAVQPAVSESGVFEKAPEFHEQTTTYEYPPDAKPPLTVHINKPDNFDSSKKTRVIMYGLAAGNGIDQTIGRVKESGQDLHFQYQHIGAQVRFLREKYPNENIVVAYVQAGKKGHISSWIKKNNGNEVIPALISDVKGKIGAPAAKISLASCSAGGGLQRAMIEGHSAIPNFIENINFFDSLHFINIERNGEKIIDWLKSDTKHRFTTISYEDAIQKMDFPGKGISIKQATALVNFFKTQGIKLEEKDADGKSGYKHFIGMNGQINIIIMKNPAETNLHSEGTIRNGLIVGETGDVSQFNKISYNNYIQKGHTNVTPHVPKAVTPQKVIRQMNGSQSGQNSKWRKQLPKGYKAANSQVVGVKAQELLGELKMGETEAFTGKDGKKYMAVKEWHTGDPRHPNPHPGISVVEVPNEGTA